MKALPDALFDLLHSGGVRYGLDGDRLWIEDDGRLTEADLAVLRAHRDALAAWLTALKQRHRDDLAALVRVGPNTWVCPGTWIPDLDVAVAPSKIVVDDGPSDVEAGRPVAPGGPKLTQPHLHIETRDFHDATEMRGAWRAMTSTPEPPS